MSYYPTERRGGCMESIYSCCRQAYVYPLDSRKLLYAAGGVVGVILVAVVWTGLLSGGTDGDFKGSSVLSETPLIVGSNFFLSNLRDLVHNQVSNISFDQNNSVFGNTSCSSCQTDIPRLKTGLVSSQFWSIDVPCEALYKDAVTLTLEQVDALTRLVNAYSTYLSTTTSSSEVTTNFNNGLIGSILAVTSGHSIDGRLAVLRVLKTLGVRVMALASSCSTDWSSAYSDVNDTGLSTFGKKVVNEINRLGIVIDLSGSSFSTQVDVLNTTSTPVIFSRGAAAALCNNSRNIQDTVLELLKNNNGVVMVTFAQEYIETNSSNSTIDSVIEHINYIKEKVGVTGVGIGAEFDASNVTFPTDLSDVSTFPTLFDKLGETWSESDLKMLAGENLMRVLAAVEQNAISVESESLDETYKLETNSSCYSDLDDRLDETANNTATTTVSSATTTTTISSITAISNASTAKTTVKTATTESVQQ